MTKIILVADPANDIQVPLNMTVTLTGKGIITRINLMFTCTIMRKLLSIIITDNQTAMMKTDQKVCDPAFQFHNDLDGYSLGPFLIAAYF